MSLRVLGRIATLHMKRANALFSLCAGGPHHARASPRPDCGARGEHYVNRLSHLTQGSRQGWAKRHRFAATATPWDPQPFSPTSNRQLHAAGRGAPPCASGPHHAQAFPRPDCGARGEHYVNRLSHLTQGSR